jgi:uncharacterized membrane protein YidH (DUF202 family)
VDSERFEGVVDATRRTRLASERTYLAWWRSAAAFAVSLGVREDRPPADKWILHRLRDRWRRLRAAGIAFIAYGLFRHQQMEAALVEGASRLSDAVRRSGSLRRAWCSEWRP